MPTSSSTPSSESLFRLGLNEALPTSEEATTSRVVVNNDILRTVVFTFDAGQVLTEHSSPRAVVVTLLEARWTSPSVSAPRGWAPATSSTWHRVTVTL